MTKRKLRKNADISPPKSPHDGIHTCSKGCSKPGCNRTLRDTIEEQDKQIEALKRDVLEKTTENARLKAEVERLKAEPDALTAYLYADTLRRDDIKTLKAHIERLTKAGDAMAAHIERNDERCYEVIPDGDIRISEWNAAKEGKPRA